MSIKGIASAVLISVSLLLLVGAGIAWVRRGRFLAAAVETPGTVVGHISDSATRSSSSGSRSAPDSVGVTETSSSPIVEFQTRDGKTIRFNSGLSSYEAGDNLTVLFMPENPSEAEIKNYFAQTGWILVVLGLGVALLIGGLALRLMPDVPSLH